jgi:DeoR/GlpR family transcriptional regulator of sugar metabolism
MLLMILSNVHFANAFRQRLGVYMLITNDVLEFINHKEKVTINDLCGAFNISKSTAHRAIIKLAGQGLVNRYHGGATALYRKIGYSEDDTNSNKRKIAKKASEIIKEDSVVILLGGFTVSEICRYISHMNITVITNSFLVFDYLKDYDNIRLIFLGGLYNPQKFEVGGILINQNLRNFRADYLFMGAASFDEKMGFTTAQLSAELYHVCIEISKVSCVLAESNKYQKSGLSVTATPEQINYLFTDDEINKEILLRIKGVGINVITS